MEKPYNSARQARKPAKLTEEQLNQDRLTLKNELEFANALVARLQDKNKSLQKRYKKSLGADEELTQIKTNLAKELATLLHQMQMECVLDTSPNRFHITLRVEDLMRLLKRDVDSGDFSKCQPENGNS